MMERRFTLHAPPALNGQRGAAALLYVLILAGLVGLGAAAWETYSQHTLKEVEMLASKEGLNSSTQAAIAVAKEVFRIKPGSIYSDPKALPALFPDPYIRENYAPAPPTVNLTARQGPDMGGRQWLWSAADPSQFTVTVPRMNQQDSFQRIDTLFNSFSSSLTAVGFAGLDTVTVKILGYKYRTPDYWAIIDSVDLRLTQRATRQGTTRTVRPVDVTLRLQEPPRGECRLVVSPAIHEVPNRRAAPANQLLSGQSYVRLECRGVVNDFSIVYEQPCSDQTYCPTKWETLVAYGSAWGPGSPENGVVNGVYPSANALVPVAARSITNTSWTTVWEARAPQVRAADVFGPVCRSKNFFDPTVPNGRFVATVHGVHFGSGGRPEDQALGAPFSVVGNGSVDFVKWEPEAPLNYCTFTATDHDNPAHIYSFSLADQNQCSGTAIDVAGGGDSFVLANSPLAAPFDQYHGVSFLVMKCGPGYSINDPGFGGNHAISYDTCYSMGHPRTRSDIDDSQTCPTQILGVGCQFCDNTDRTFNNMGCFGAGTLITMANGERRPVEAVHSGDRIYSPYYPEGLAVWEVRTGPEHAALIKLVTSAHELRVTGSHPMFTQDGLRKAVDVRVGDVLLTAGGQATVTEVGTVPVHGEAVNVWNLRLALPDGDDDISLRVIVADGIVTGDLTVQELLEREVTSDHD